MQNRRAIHVAWLVVGVLSLVVLVDAFGGSLSITGPSAIPVGTTTRYSATGSTSLPYSWSSSDSGVATVQSATTNGTAADVHGVAPGTSMLTVTDAASQPSSATKPVTVVGVDKVQYQEGSDGSFIDVAGNLYVMLGTTVNFKALPNPSYASFPAGKPVWGGTSGASGSGTTKQVTFSTRSSNGNDFKTVTVECGNTVTVNVLVYELTTLLSIGANNFPGRDKHKFGVAQVVSLDYSTVPGFANPTANIGAWSGPRRQDRAN